TLLALVMMPILLDFYAADFTRQISQAMIADGSGVEFVIPTLNIVVSLALVLVPVAGGMVLRHFSPPWAKTFEDSAGFFAIIVILFLLGTAFLRHGYLFLATPWQVYFAAISVGLFGFFFGYWVSRLFGVQPLFQRAISLETGIQNGPVSFAIILLSFPQQGIQDQMIWLAILYSTFIVITSSFITLFLRKRGKFDWEVHRNTVVHNRLFGDEYVTGYPAGFLPPRIANDPSQGTSPSQKRGA
ncbi:hypothetical protein QLX67_09980, partial [Balneolaceae bacterium ANBcel3]|nr:hypothetical protein [Balneolaceae bacterium ANBcel3]